MDDDGTPQQSHHPKESPPGSGRSHEGFAKGHGRRLRRRPDAFPAGHREGNPKATPPCSFPYSPSSFSDCSSANRRGNSLHHSEGHENSGQCVGHWSGSLYLGLRCRRFPAGEVYQRRTPRRGLRVMELLQLSSKNAGVTTDC